MTARSRGGNPAIVLAQAQRQQVLKADARALSNGYQKFEQAHGIWWTNGDAAVPAELFAGMSGPGMLMLHFGCTTQYLEEGAVGRAAGGGDPQRQPFSCRHRRYLAPA